MPHLRWNTADDLAAYSYECGHCNAKTASTRGFLSVDEDAEVRHRTLAWIYICPECLQPTYIRADVQIPTPLPDEPVKGLPEKVDKLYEEARRATAAKAFTSSVLTCRTILVHIAVEKGAPPARLSFQAAIEYLEARQYVTVHSKPWVDKIRDMGNEATHEIRVLGEADAKIALKFTRNLLRTAYEMKHEYDQTVPPPGDDIPF